MTRIIAYDIANKRRLHRVAKCCELYGGRIEKSVFELELDDRRFELFWKEVNSLINPQADTLVAFPMCEMCRGKVLIVGQMKKRDEDSFLFF